jgi:mono/diheme cytochrome c family protein
MTHSFVVKVAVASATVSIVFGLGLNSVADPYLEASQNALAPVAEHRALLDRYCVGCHNQRAKTAGLTFDTMDLGRVANDAEIWEKTIRKVRAGMMPPPGSRRPEPGVLDAFARWLEHALDEAAAKHPNPGRVALHRLNRLEYGNSIEDLLGIRIDASAYLPKDDEADGFDNIAVALRVSPSFLDQYVSAARLVALRAVGTPATKPTSVTYRPARGTDQYRRVEGLPPGTRGGLLVEHLFPVDGEYRFNIGGLANAFYMRNMEYEHTVIVTIDGVTVFKAKVGGEEDLKAIDQQQAPAVAAVSARFQNIATTVTAGPHAVGVTFIARAMVESDEVLASLRLGAGEERMARIGSLEITGPFTPTGLGDTPSRRRIFICRPASASDELPCATRIFSTLARRAYRRPVTADDLRAALAFYKEGRAEGDFDTGIQRGMVPILASPKFLFRAERAPDGVAPGTVYRVTDLDLASRLSFFLTSRVPDDELLNLAASGRLRQPAVLEQQVRRLLGDPRSTTLVTGFASQWLKLRAMDDIDPDGIQFPNFDPSLREAFRREIGLFIQSIVGGDRSVLDLLTADHTFLNERLALHYGVPNVRGDAFQRVTLTDPNRRGLLGKGAVLMATSYANRTAPVIRGAWILENILGTPPASPPPDVEGFQENKAGEQARTVREIMEIHRRKPTCNACHGVMDPIGFALENFDAIGAWRSVDRFAGEAVDGSGVLIDGTTVSGPSDLVDALTRRPEQFVQTFTEKLMTYALGRGLDAHDMPAVRTIVRDAARDQYRFSSIVLGMTRSAPFLMRKSDDASASAVAAH